MEFNYIAYTEGNKLINGSVAAATERSANERLTKLGYHVLSLKLVTPLTMDISKLLPSTSKVKTDTVVTFARQMATLINAGVNVVTSLELIQAQTVDPTFKSVLRKILVDIRSGQKLSDAMSKHPNIFSSLFCRSLSVGEQSGELGKVLFQTAEYLEKGVTARKSIKSALTYPIITIVVALVVVVILVSFVFPTFIGMYNSMGAELPLITKILLSVVDVMKIAGPYLLGILIIGVIGILLYIRRPSGKYNFDKFLLKLPLMGHIILLRELAISCQSMSLLFHTGLPLVEIIDVLIDSSGNKVVTEALTKVKKSVFKGEGLSQPMSQNPVFLPMMVQMVKVGEETGEMDTTLMAVAQNYNAEADNRTRAFIAVIQPTITIVIGIFVAFIVLSMLSLMYSIYGQINV
jgi:type IV pilus assembly protein PilC